ncbi:MAG: hypothetical protein ACM3SV_06495 [Betaproteobacteria bacterium]
MKRISIFALLLSATLGFSNFLAPAALAASDPSEPRMPARESAQDRLQKAEAMFQERCKKAGEKIYKTVDNVEGIFLMKVRPKSEKFNDQWAMDDPYGRDLGGDGYIGSFLTASFDLMRHPNPKPGWPLRLGYAYVEAIDPQDGKRYRYTGAIKQVTKTSSPMIGGNGKTFLIKEFVLDKAPSTAPMPRYGVTYDDISTMDEREYWIAGSSLKVIDLKTKEVLAERIGYMMDRGQGSRGAGSGRSPWLLAADHACPDFHRFPNPIVVEPGSSAQIRQTQDFVEKVLHPKKDK